MISVNPEDLPEVVANVTRWPLHDRIKLVQEILQTVDDAATGPQTSVGKRMTADEVVALLQMPQPAPTDEECDEIIDEYRMRKYGG